MNNFFSRWQIADSWWRVALGIPLPRTGSLPRGKSDVDNIGVCVRSRGRGLLFFLLFLSLSSFSQTVKLLGQQQLNKWNITPGNYSGISHVKDNVYAIVDDKDKVDGFKLLTLDIDLDNGKIRNASIAEPEGMKERRAKGEATNRDCEGVAYFPEANTVFVSGEEEQRILEYSLDGRLTGRELAIPSIMQRKQIVSNRGFEALAYNGVQKRFWTTTESTLPADGKLASAKNPDVYNRLRFVAFDTSLKPVESFVYSMDLPKATDKEANTILGVPSLIALDDGRLIVMEREGCFPKKQYGSWVRIKLYIVNPKDSKSVSLSAPMSGVGEDAFMKKTLLCEFITRLRLGKMNLSNYEGMCLGPKLHDGRQTLILIADSQNGMGNWMYHIKDHIRVVIVDI